MELVLDLHLHSRFSRAVSPRMNLQNMYLWGRKKGINILSVTDFTHPIWFKEAENLLEEIQSGIYKLKDTSMLDSELGTLLEKKHIGPYFMLSTEVSAIYTEHGKSHRIHNLIFAPNFETAGKINQEFMRRGINVSADGRPILGLSTRDLCELLFEISPKTTIIPCHIWTPWFSLYGSRSGYDRISDCFGEFAPRIFAVETGLSSDPAMNWRIPELDSRSIVSFSDAHSLEKMGREATVLRAKSREHRVKLEDITYENILNGLVHGRERVFELAYTIEYYPEEGKYHYTGHRNCGVSLSPSETRMKGEMCSVCHRPLTVGVMHRVEDLAKREEKNFSYKTDAYGVVWVIDPKNLRPPSVSLVPLLEILSEALGVATSSQKVQTVFNALIQGLGSEHEILLRVSIDEIRKLAGVKIAEGVEKVRGRNISIIPGFDGEYGKVSIWSKDGAEKNQKDDTQMGLGI